MKLKFLGAASNVTGSRFLLEAEDKVVLIDCGLYQERDLLERNWEKFPFKPSKIDAVLLTHAHIDHCGYLPRLIKEGYRGKIYCTLPTAEIAKVALLDSANIQEADAQYKKKRHAKEGRKGPHPEMPLYTVEDVKKVFAHFHHIRYEKPIYLGKNLTAIFYEAGHILGAAMIHMECLENGAVKKIIFSGDIGRWGRPILNDPHLFNEADYIVMEGTYGDRFHNEDVSCLDELERVINTTYQQGGNIIIPSFAIGRTQEILYHLNVLLKAKRIPTISVFVDSPMAMEITEIVNSYPDYFNEEAREILRQGLDLFNFPLLKFTPTPNESKAINQIHGTSIIMAGGGMCTGGRIKHHLALNLPRPESTILFVGYQALGTLGRIILEKPEEVRILGKKVKVNANIKHINGFSSHADQRELLKWVGAFKKQPQKVFIVHSEKKVAEALKVEIQKIIKTEINIPTYSQEFIF